MINGIINVYKEKGFTSHDVVAKLRGIFHQKKIGHTGTLDPDAVGVLPVCLGRGTKLCDMLTDKDKVYEAVMLLGKTTDTQDVSGKVLTEAAVNVEARTVVETIESFIGEYDQVPPMYSALKHNGKKLYELARAGIEVERKPRTVQIKSILINEMNLDDSDEKTVTFTVECSKGTYIRTLCQDVGEKLGCGACMKSLKRTRVSEFCVKDSLTLEQIEKYVANGEIGNYIKSVDAMFPDYTKIVVGDDFSKLLYNGNQFPVTCVEETPEICDLEMVRVYDTGARFIGIYKLEGEMFKPVKIFYDSEQNENTK